MSIPSLLSSAFCSIILVTSNLFEYDIKVEVTFILLILLFPISNIFEGFPLVLNLK